MLNSIVAFQHSKKESSPQKKDFQSEQPFSFSAFSFSPQKEYKEKKGGDRGGGGWGLTSISCEGIACTCTKKKKEISEGICAPSMCKPPLVGQHCCPYTKGIKKQTNQDEGSPSSPLSAIAISHFLVKEQKLCE